MLRRIRRGFRLAAPLLVATSAVLASAAGQGIVERVSIATDGTEGNLYSFEAAATPNGKIVVFGSYASNLVTGDTNGASDIFLRDRKAGTTTRLSVDADGNEGNGSSYDPCISANGRWVLFYSNASNLVPGDENNRDDVFLLDRKTGELRMVSLAEDGTPGDGYSYIYGSSLSANGRYAAIYSQASTLVEGDDNGQYDVFFLDLKTGAVTLLSAAGDGTPGDDDSDDPSMSPNGRYVVFYSASTNLLPGLNNGESQIYEWDRKHGVLYHASPADGGGPAGNSCYDPVVSQNGDRVVFYSYATDLVPDADTNGDADEFLYDFRTGTMTRLSEDADGATLAGSAYEASISQSGNLVVFYTSQALLPEDDNGAYSAYAYDVKSGTLRLLSKNADGVTGDADAYVFATSLTPSGRWMALSDLSSNLVADDTNGQYDVFLVDPRR
jgi:Tol biopolymer transport system component